MSRKNILKNPVFKSTFFSRCILIYDIYNIRTLTINLKMFCQSLKKLTIRSLLIIFSEVSKKVRRYFLQNSSSKNSKDKVMIKLIICNISIIFQISNVVNKINNRLNIPTGCKFFWQEVGTWNIFWSIEPAVKFWYKLTVVTKSRKNNIYWKNNVI